MTADAWIALVGVFLIQLSIAWGYTLKLEARLTNIEAALDINGKGRGSQASNA